MDKIGRVIKEKFNTEENSNRLAMIRQAIFSNADVQTFLANYHLTEEDAIIKRSLSKLHEYVQYQYRLEEGLEGKVQNYYPKLIMNVNYIDVEYHPTANLLEQRKLYERRKRIHLVSLPQSLKEASFNDFEKSEAEHQKIVRELIAYATYLVQSPQMFKPALYLHGPFGVGKTHVLSALANALAEKNIRTTLVHYPKFLVDMKHAIGDNTIQEKLNELMEAEVLVLDDIGAESNTAWTRDDVLGVILQHRMQEQLPTFFTSNFSMDELEQHLAQSTRGDSEPVKARRIMERIAFLSREVLMSGSNRRHEG